MNVVLSAILIDAVQLAASGDKSDRDLAQTILRYLCEMPVSAGADRTKESAISSEKIRLAEEATRGSFPER